MNDISEYIKTVSVSLYVFSYELFCFLLEQK